MTSFFPQRHNGSTARHLRTLLALSAGLLAPAMWLAATSAKAADCATLVGTFNAAAEAGREKEAQVAIDQVAVDTACSGLQTQMQRRLSALRLTFVQGQMAKDKPLKTYETVLLAAEKPQVLWQASATLAELRFGARAFGEAALVFDRAIEIVKNEALTPVAPAPDEIQRLLDRAAQARLLAANQQAGKGSKDGFVQTAANTAGGLGGVYSPVVRGIVPRAVPMPITFDYRSADLTPVGLLAVQELLRAIQEQQPAKLRVIGHTDPKGTPEYNLKLSKARAEAVATYLRSNGVVAAIETDGVGANEPLQVDASTGLSADDLNALNRRVEWRRE